MRLCGRLRAENGKALDCQNLLVENQAELPRCLVRDCFKAGQSLRVPDSFSRLVTGRSVMPQGLISAKSPRSVVTLKANPCEVTPRET